MASYVPPPRPLAEETRRYEVKIFQPLPPPAPPDIGDISEGYRLFDWEAVKLVAVLLVCLVILGGLGWFLFG